MSVSPEESNIWERVARRAVPGCRLVRAWALAGGMSAQMTVLEVEREDGSREKLVVRCPGDGHAEDEFRLLEWAVGSGAVGSGATRHGLAVPRVVGLDGSGEILARPYFVMEWIEGQPDFRRLAAGEADPLARQMAQELAKIHRVEVRGGALDFLAHTDAALVELGKKGVIEGALGWSRLAGTLRIAKKGQGNPDALLHGDFWPGNLLWREGRLVAVIDWEDAVLGDPLVDFAICRLEVLWIYGQEMYEAFSRAYRDEMAIDFGNLPYWDLYAALRLARLMGDDLEGWAAFYEPYDRDDITPESIRQHFDWFVRQAMEGCGVTQPPSGCTR